MNPDLERLQAYPFQRLKQLLDGRQPADKSAIKLSIGEPAHPPPAFVLDTLRDSLNDIARYPATKGEVALREAMASWLCQRFQLPALDPETEVLPVSGTREALFAVAQACIDRSQQPLVISPNPFYQIYEGAALMAGADLRWLDCRGDSGFLPDFTSLSEADWKRCQLLYICSPGNPSGAVIPESTLQWLIEQAQRYDFIIASDECYSEIYLDEATPPPGLLQAAAAMGHTDYRQCLVFHSLSKRSNLPGLRSGLVAGDAAILKRFLQYRTYQGCAMPLPQQLASIAAWQDEQHVQENRQRYREKFEAVLPILQPVMSVQRPEAGFYLWPTLDESDTEFAADLYAEENVTVLPGSFLGRGEGASNPGAGHCRLALVAELEQCVEAAQRIAGFCQRRSQ